LNIITNAWQAMKEAHGEGELVIHADRSGDRVRIIFEDNGPGISPEHIGRIFDPFFTTKEVGEGTGLGLSLTHGIVRRHGGEIWAESVPGKGARIYVEVPLAPLYEAEMAEPLAAELAQMAEIKPRVLIVNDEVAFRELLSISLAEDGRQVDRARNAEEAWDMVQSQHYDCIVLNLWMPWMNGQTLYYRIKEYSEELAQSCIFVTGAHRSQGVQEFLAATGNLSLSKPFSLREIRQLVVQTLGLDDI
jgi:CheY-like chemotaxis protein